MADTAAPTGPPQPPPGYAYVRADYAQPRTEYIEAPRPVPQSTFQMAGQSLGDVTQGLRRTPIALMVLLLNIIGIGAAVYFLNVLIKDQSHHMTEVIEADAKQFNLLIDMHAKEFDALLALAARNNVPAVPAVTPPVIPPTVPATPIPPRSR